MTGQAPNAHPLDRLLGQRGDLAREVVATTQTALRSASPDMALAMDRSLLFQVAEAIQSHRQVWEDALVHTLSESEQGTAGPEAAQPGRREWTLDQLTLVDESQAEQDIEISRTVQLVDLRAEWEWREFQAFSAKLQGDSTLSKQADNPLRPAVFARALSRATDALPLAANERQMLLRVAAKALADVLKAFYARACSELRQQGHKPLAYKAVKQAPSRPPAVGPDVTRPGALHSLLDKLPAQASTPAHFATPAAQSATPTPGQLTFLPLHDAPTSPTASHTATSSPARSYTPEQVSNLLARLFAQMHADQAVVPAVRQLIAQLQPAVMRVAQHDPQLLQSDQHPAWRLINQMASQSSGYSTEADQAGLTEFLDFIQARIQPLLPAPGPTPAQLENALGDIQQFIAQQGQHQLQDSPQAVAQLQEADMRLSLRPILLQQVEQQLAGIRIKSSIHAFLLGPWIDVLCQTMATGSPDDDESQAMLVTVDDLIHSLQRPRTLDEREALKKGLPDLIGRLQRGLARIEWPQAEQDAIFKDLMGIHGHHLLAAPKPVKSPADASAQELVAQMQAEMRTQNLPGQVGPGHLARQRHAKALDTHIGSLPTVPMGWGDDAVAMTPIHWVDSLQQGIWCKLLMQGQWTTARLLWTSANRQFFVFTSDKAGRMHSMTRRAMERLRAEGLATSLEDRSLMQRAVDSVLQDLDSTS